MCLLAVAIAAALKGFTFCFRCCGCICVAHCDVARVAAVVCLMVNAVFCLAADAFDFVHKIHSLHHYFLPKGFVYSRKIIPERITQ